MGVEGEDTHRGEPVAAVEAEGHAGHAAGGVGLGRFFRGLGGCFGSAPMGFAMILAAAGLLAAARFAIAPARTRRTWLVALVATELGHVWAVLAAILAVVAAARVGEGGTMLETGLRAVSAVLAAVAAGLFARPALSAARLAGRAKREMTTVFGVAQDDAAAEPYWAWARLFRPLASCLRVGLVRSPSGHSSDVRWV